MLAGTVTDSSSISTGSCSTSSSRWATFITSATSCDTVEQHRELVATEPGDRVARSEAFAEPTRHRAQQRVTGRVPEAVVHRLEVVEVDEHDRDPRTRAPAAQAGLVEAVDEQRAIRELGEVIAEHALLELARQLALHCDVAHGDDEPGDILVAEHVHDAHLEVTRLTLAVDEHADELFVDAERQRVRGGAAGGRRGPTPPLRATRRTAARPAPRRRCRGSHSHADSRTRSHPPRSTTKIASFRPCTSAPRRRRPVTYTRGARAGREMPQPQRDETEHRRSRTHRERAWTTSRWPDDHASASGIAEHSATEVSTHKMRSRFAGSISMPRLVGRVRTPGRDRDQRQRDQRR